MLEPNARCGLHDVFRPPPDHFFDGGVLCTYSVSLSTLLSIPAALLVEAPEDFDRALSPANAPRLLAAVRRTFGKLVVFCEESRIIAGHQLSPIIADAEGVVREVRVRGGGAFHPKLWLLRFKPENVEMPGKLRLAILSRNLTKDRCWDIGAILDGEPASATAESKTISNFLVALPALARRPLSPARLSLVRELAEQTQTTTWRAPSGLSDPVIHIAGLGKGWKPPPSKCLAVISPFLQAKAIKSLRSDTKRGLFLVSRPDAMNDVAATAKSSFEQLYVLARPVEAMDTPANSEAGLHAKIYVWDQGRRTRIAIGSANATSPALDGANIEIVLDMDCTAAVKGGVRKLLEATQLSKVLIEYDPQQTPDSAAQLPDTRYSRRRLIDAGLSVKCTATPDGIAVAIQPSTPLDLSVGRELIDLTFWPATCADNIQAECLDALMRGQPAPYPVPLSLAVVTGFIGFTAKTKNGSETFTLNLPVVGLNEADRRKAIASCILPTQESFLDFVRMLLGDARGLEVDTTDSDGQGSAGTRSRSPGLSGVLESLVKCAADQPERLRSIETAFDDLLSTKGIVPESFRLLWKELQEATNTNVRPRRPRNAK